MMEEKMNPGFTEIDVEKLDQVSGGKRSYFIHIVQYGENMHTIADKYGVRWTDIYKLNKRDIGDDPNMIYPGQKLKIPQ